MAGEPVVTIVGNLTGDPELRFTPSGAAVANFTVASTPRTFDRQSNEWKEGETLFMRCSIWRDPAENVAESLTRGMRVIVNGRIKSRSYEKDGVKHTVIEMDVDEVGPSLRYANAKVNKVTRAGAQEQQWGGQATGDPWASPQQQSTNPPQQQQQTQPQQQWGGQQDQYHQTVPPSDPVGLGWQSAPPQQQGWGNHPRYDEPRF